MPMPDTKAERLDEQIFNLSREMLALDPGPLAELRRIEHGVPGPSAYWRLAAKCGFLEEDAERWMRIVKIMAILTPKGQHQVTDRLHEKKRRLGAVLCDGGDPGWKPRSFDDPDGIIPQHRLARFLALPEDQRAPALERLARSIARTRQRDCGVNCTEIAWLILWSDPKQTLQNLARDYFQRLDRAARSANDKEQAA
jgi:CRISPR system Cascade subunit CasB